MDENHQHVAPDGSHESLDDVLKVAVGSKVDKDMREDARRKLLAFPPIDIVKSLGESLTSDDSSTRREAVSVLAWIVSIRADISTGVIPSILGFFCSRLSDWSSVEPSVQGIKELYLKHISPSARMEYLFEDDSSIAKDRSDLSLMLGFASSSQLPPRTGSVTERVLSKLLINVHAPSFGRQVRLEVLSVFKLLLRDFTDDLIPIAEIVVRGLAIEGEDERDPSCLLTFFEAIDLVFETQVFKAASSSSLDELFETVKSYFPIQLVEKDSEDSTELRKALNRCLVRFELQSIEFLSPQLDTSATSEDAYVALLAIGKERPNDLIPFLLAEWNSSPSILTKKLWQSTIAATDESIVEGVVSRLVSTHEDDLLIVTANSGPRPGAIALEELVRQSRDFSDIIPKIILDAELIPVSSEVANTIAASADLSAAEDVVSRILTRVTEQAVIKRIIVHVSPLVETVSECTARILRSLFDHHLVLTMEFIEIDSFVHRLLQHSNAVSGHVLLAIFKSGHRNIVAAIENDFDQIESAFSDVDFSTSFFTIRCNPELVAQISPHAFACLCDGLPEPQRERLIRLAIIDLQKVSFLSELKPEQLACVATEIVWEDAVAAALSLPAPLAKGAVAVSLSAAASVGKDLKYMLKYCGDDEVWAAVVSEWDAAEVFDQLIVGRVGKLVAIGPTQLKRELIDQWEERSVEMEFADEICVKLLASCDGESLLSHCRLVESVLLRQCSNLLEWSRVVIKYAIVNQNLDTSFVTSIVVKLTDLVAAELAIDRFAVVQAISVLPEVVPVGKLLTQKPAVLRSLRLALDGERTQVVRKQIAVGITNWFNL